MGHSLQPRQPYHPTPPSPWSPRPAVPLQALQPLIQARGDPCYLETGHNHPPPETRKTQKSGRILPPYLTTMSSLQGVRETSLHQNYSPCQPLRFSTRFPLRPLHYHSSSPTGPPDSRRSQPPQPHTPHRVHGSGFLQSLRHGEPHNKNNKHT